VGVCGGVGCIFFIDSTNPFLNVQGVAERWCDIESNDKVNIFIRLIIIILLINH